MPQEPLPPTFPPAEMIYDEIMGSIDPRLKTTELGMLPHRYNDMQQVDREKVLKEFALAFVNFEQKYREYHESFKRKVDEYKSQVKEWAQGAHSAKDAEMLQALEQFFAAPPMLPTQQISSSTDSPMAQAA